MVNVLPPQMQEAAAREARARFIIIGSLVFMIAGLVAFVAVVPSYVLVQLPAPQIQSPQQTSDVNDAVALKATQNLVTLAMGSVGATTTPTDVITQVIQDRTNGISIDTISYQSGELILNGSADTSADLEQYRTALLADTHFKQVSVPVSSLFGTNDGRFSITIDGNF